MNATELRINRKRATIGVLNQIGDHCWYLVISSYLHHDEECSKEQQGVQLQSREDSLHVLLRQDDQRNCSKQSNPACVWGCDTNL